MDNATSFAITYLPDSDLSVGYRYPSYIQLDPDVLRETLFFIKLILLFHGTVLSTALLTVLPRVNVEFRQHNFSKTKGKKCVFANEQSGLLYRVIYIMLGNSNIML